MLLLLYIAISIEVLFILALVFKTPYNRSVILSLDWFKRGHGPIVVSTVGSTLMVVLCSSLYSMTKFQQRILVAGVLNPTDKVVMSKYMVEASLVGFSMFLYVTMDRLHRYLRELPVLRRSMEYIKEQEKLTNHISTLISQIEKLRSERDSTRNETKNLENEVEAFEKQIEPVKKEMESLRVRFMKSIFYE